MLVQCLPVPTGVPRVLSQRLQGRYAYRGLEAFCEFPAAKSQIFSSFGLPSSTFHLPHLVIHLPIQACIYRIQHSRFLIRFPSYAYSNSVLHLAIQFPAFRHPPSTLVAAALAFSSPMRRLVTVARPQLQAPSLQD